MLRFVWYCGYYKGTGRCVFLVPTPRRVLWDACGMGGGVDEFWSVFIFVFLTWVWSVRTYISVV